MSICSIKTGDFFKNCRFCVRVLDEPIMKCSACKTVPYCSRNCQKKDWKRHKIKCKHLRTASTDFKTYLLFHVKDREEVKSAVCFNKFLGIISNFLKSNDFNNAFNILCLHYHFISKELVPSFAKLKLDHFKKVMELNCCSKIPYFEIITKLFAMYFRTLEKPVDLFVLTFDGISDSSGEKIDYEKMKELYFFIFEKCCFDDIIYFLDIIEVHVLYEIDDVAPINMAFKRIENLVFEGGGRTYPIDYKKVLNKIGSTFLCMPNLEIREFIIERSEIKKYFSCFKGEYVVNNGFFEMYSKEHAFKKLKRVKFTKCKHFLNEAEKCVNAATTLDSKEKSKIIISLKKVVHNILKMTIPFNRSMKFKMRLLKTILKNKMEEIYFYLKIANKSFGRVNTEDLAYILKQISSLDESFLSEYIRVIYLQHAKVSLLHSLNSQLKVKNAEASLLFSFLLLLEKISFNISLKAMQIKDVSHAFDANLAFLIILSTQMSFPGSREFAKLYKDGVVSFPFVCDANILSKQKEVLKHFKLSFNLEEVLYFICKITCLNFPSNAGDSFVDFVLMFAEKIHIIKEIEE